MKKEIHIVHGDSAGGVLRQAIHPKPGTLLVSFDPMSFGPLTELQDLGEWRRFRRSFFESIYPYEPLYERKYDLLLNADKLREADKIHLWIGSGLEEQILLVWTVQLFRHLNMDIEKLKVIQFCEIPGKGYEAVGVSILNPEFLSDHPEPKTLSGDEADYARRVWKALTASRPNLLLEVIDEKNDAPLKLLKRSLHFLIRRFPDIATGLSFWDAELIKNTAMKGPQAVRIIAHAVANGWGNLDWIGDLILYDRLRRLGDSSLREKAVSLQGKRAEVRYTEVHLTEFGRKLRDGKENFVKVNGIDEWICGVHLDSRSNHVWYRDNKTLVTA